MFKKVHLRTSYIYLFPIEKILKDEGEQLIFNEEFECVNTDNNYHYFKGFTILIECEQEDLEFRLKDLMNSFDKLSQNGYRYYYKIED